MLKVLNAVDFFGLIGLDLNLSDTMFWLYVAQAAVVFIGLIMFFILLARTRRSRREQVVEKVVVVEEPVQETRKQKKHKKEEPAVVQETTAAATVAEPQPQVIVVNPAPVTPVAEPAKDKEKVERILTGITLDVGVVQREFTIGEEFNCDGLLVRANYNFEPLAETIIAYSVVDNEVYDRLQSVSEIKVCYVLRPELTETGIKFVTVKYADQTAIYTVSVKEAAPVVEKVEEVEQPIVVERVVVKEVPTPIVEEKQVETVIIDEETAEAGKLRYDRSFMARLIQSDDEVKHWYTELKNRLLSYKKVHARMSWKRETFKSGKEVVAKLAYRGKTLCLYLPINPADYVETKYDVEDVSNVPAFADTPSMVRVKNDKHARIAQDLITISMQQKGIKDLPHVSVDYYVPYEGVVELINKGLIKREIKTSADEAIFVRNKATETEEVDNDTKTVTEIIVTSKTLDEAEAVDNDEALPKEHSEQSDKKSKREKKSK